MKKLFSQEIILPEGVDVKKEDKKIIVKGNQGEASKEFNFGKIKFEKKDGKILLSHPAATRKEKRMINTIVAHLKNLINGVQNKFEYKLKVCSSHFPINIEMKGNNVLIKNFLGEKTPRKCILPKGAEIEINKDIITIKSSNREIAGQAAANFETVTKVRNRDRRVFQDGVYITSKPGREM